MSVPSLLRCSTRADGTCYYYDCYGAQEPESSPGSHGALIGSHGALIGSHGALIGSHGALIKLL